MAIVTLTTDFGLKDPYAGIMKGALLSVSPATTIVDITHEVPPQNIAAAGRILAGAHSFFPPGAIHVAVVDPGVGSGRAILLVKAAGSFFLVPDNGLLTPVLERFPPEQAVRVENRRYFRKHISGTFHGRDIFAPVAGHLANGVRPSLFGPAADPEDIKQLAGKTPQSRGAGFEDNGALQGMVVTVDHFGNLITDIEEDAVARAASRVWDDAAPWEPAIVVNAGPALVRGMAGTYSDVPKGSLLALFGSGGFLEIAVNNGNAASTLNIKEGEPVSVTLGKMRER